jgi:hypothetical protein
MYLVEIKNVGKTMYGQNSEVFRESGKDTEDFLYFEVSLDTEYDSGVILLEKILKRSDRHYKISSIHDNFFDLCK